MRTPFFVGGLFNASIFKTESAMATLLNIHCFNLESSAFPDVDVVVRRR